jgi:hypothetical protein
MAKTLPDMTLAELRAVLGWSGNEHVPISEILAQTVAASGAAAEQHQAQQREREGARDAWLAGREAARREAYSASLARARKPAGPDAHADAREVAHAARVEYERTHPLPDGLNPAILAEQPSLVQRVVQKVKGKPEPEPVT